MAAAQHDRRQFFFKTASFLTGFLSLVTTFGWSSAAGNILVSPLLGQGSHFYLSAAIGEQLVIRGYNVTCLVSNAFEDHVRKSRYGTMFTYEVFQHPIPVSEVHGMFGELNELFLTPDHEKKVRVKKKLDDARVDDCKALLADEMLLSRLRSVNFSVVLYDVTWLCGALVAEAFDIPYFAVIPYPASYQFTYIHGSGFNAALHPSIMTGFNNQMSFTERLINVGAFAYSIHVSTQDIKEIVDDKVSRSDIAVRTKLFLANNNFPGEFSYAVPPNVIPVGGLTTREASELPPELEEFVQGSGEDGVIICSFGSFFTLGQRHIKLIRTFSDVFGQLPQRVVWLLKSEPPFPLPPNVKILPWLPQNDILGHPKTRAMFYHAGHNSYYETIYHGVPSVVMPIWNDQRDVAGRVVHFGMGVSIDKMSVTEDILLKALREITSNSSYGESAKRLSAAFRNRPLKPAERAAFWIDHAINHGTEFLQIRSDHINILQRNSIDVIAFILLILTILVYLVYRLVACSLSCMYRLIGKKSKIDYPRCTK